MRFRLPGIGRCVTLTPCLFRMFETFLALNLETTTDTILALVITKLLQVIMRVYSNGIYRVRTVHVASAWCTVALTVSPFCACIGAAQLVHTQVLRRPTLDWDTFFAEKWFVLFSLDYDRAIFISDQACTMISSAITLALRFDGQTDVGEVMARCFSALLIDWLKDITVSYTLLQLGADWFHTFKTRTTGYFWIMAGAVNAASLMMLFYAFSYMASKSVLD